MSDWPSITIGELVQRGSAEIKTGPFGTQLKASHYVETGCPVINVRNVGQGELTDAKLEHVGPETVERLKSHLLEVGDIVFGRKAAVDRHLWVTDQDGWMQGSDCLRLRLDNGVISTRFASFYLRTAEHRDWILRQSSHGSTMATLNQAIIERITIPFPPLETQRRIASILGAYDDLIAVNRQRIAVLEEMARGLFEECFVRFRFPGHEAVPILNTPDGPLPEGWRQTTVSEVFELLRGRSYRSAELAGEGGMPFVNLKCMERDGGFRISGLKRFTGDYKPNHVVARGDIVMAVTDMTQERRIVGRAARIPLLDEPKAVISMDLVKVRPEDGVDQLFLYCWLRYTDFGIRAAQHANGANVLHLSPKAIVDLPFVAPPSNVQEEFGRTVEPLFTLAEVLAVAERRLSASRDLLLPRLISGQLSVTGAERELEEAA